MDGNQIHRLRTSWRLPARGADRLKPRLAQVQTDLLDGALDGALALAGVRAGEEVCVRRLGVSVRLRAARSDAILAADWAAAIGTALTETLAQAQSREGDPFGDQFGNAVVRYRSRMGAWLDCALGVVRGDLGRSWAWTRLGLWRAGADGSPQGAAAELVRGLAFAPESVVPVLVGLARHRALGSLAARLDGAGWTLLAAAALAAHGVSATLLNQDPDQAPREHTPHQGPGWNRSGSSSAGAAEERDRDWDRDWDRGGSGGARAHGDRTDLAQLLPQVLGSPLSSLLEVADGDGAWPRILLVLLAWDPALGRRRTLQVRDLAVCLVASPPAPGTAAAVRPDGPQGPAGEFRSPGTEGLAERPGAAEAADPASQTIRPGGRGHPGSGRGPDREGPEPGRGFSADRGPGGARPVSAEGDDRGIEGTGRPGMTVRAGDQSGQGPGSIQAEPRRPEPRRSEPWARAAETPETPVDTRPQGEVAHQGLAPTRRAQGLSDWGGLMLLLNLLGPAGVLEDQAVPPPGRTLSWTLHRLALALVPLASDDPAALAFAGLAPGAAPPDLERPPTSAAETGLVADLRDRVQARLHLVLAGEPEPGTAGESRAALLARICRRPAEILADPGWIEVRFPLSTLSTPVRRVGLDLDPGWLPWLGVVVRFVYE